MDYQQIIKSQTSLGIQYTFKDFNIFFGNKNANLHEIQRMYSNKFLIELKQTHGDNLIQHPKTAIIENNYDLQEGDAHTTESDQHGLLIKTADCLPVFVVDPGKDTCLAIHAGWRGVANNIVIKSIENSFSHAKELKLFIGPHIHQDSFEIDVNVLEKLTVGINPEKKNNFYYSKLNHKYISKYFFNLSELLKYRIENELQIKNISIIDVNIDTFVNTEFHSFRRDREHAGRNYSLIIRN